MKKTSYEYWKPIKRIERSYARSLQVISTLMYNSIADIKDPQKIVFVLRKLSKQEVFRQHCQNLAMKMVTSLYQKNNIGWRQAALANGKGREIYAAIQNELNSGMLGHMINEQIAINAAMITTLPVNVAVEFADYIQNETYTGRRASDIADELRAKITGKSKAKVDLIARTEVSKTQCAMIKARAESLGLDWYIWRTSKDSRVRSAHDSLDGVLVRWSDPPSPEALNGEKRTYGHYHAGNIFNCRCYPEPVLDISQVKFPCKVYSNGKIRKITNRTDFIKLTA